MLSPKKAKYYTGHKTLETQADVNVFAKGEYDISAGTFVIHGEFITHISGLSRVKRAEGDIYIWRQVLKISMVLGKLM